MHIARVGQGETVDELRARLALLREHGVSSHDPTTGFVTFFAAASPEAAKSAPTPIVSQHESEESAKAIRDRAARRAEAELFAATEGWPDDYDTGAH